MKELKQFHKHLLKNEFNLPIGLRTIAGAKANESFLEKGMKDIPVFEYEKHSK